MKIRVLLFEDEPTVRKLLQYVLESRGYEVRDFEDPSLCPLARNEACVSACADILISDIRMPHMDGLEFIEQQMKRGCPIRNVALISGNWTSDEAERAEAAGCFVMKKPFTMKDLNEWLDACERRIDPSRELTDEPLLSAG